MSAARFDWVLPEAHPVAPPRFTGVPLVDRVLQARGIATEDAAHAFLQPREQALADPRLLPDLERAAAMVRAALERKARIVVYGDYDVDGICATAMLTRVLKRLGTIAEPMIPHRMQDGYGLTPATVARIQAQRGDLIIAVDCGSSSPNEIADLLAADAEVIVLDHHALTVALPDGAALVSTQRPDNRYPSTNLCAAAVAWMLVRQLLGDKDAQMYLPYAVLASVADVVPLLGENRTLVARGLPLLRRWGLPGLKALCALAHVEQRDITTHHLGFILGPRLNAAGRMASPELALRLLLADSLEEAGPLAQQLDDLNTQRRSAVDTAVEQAHELLRAGADPHSRSVLVVDHAAWSIGWVGIVASRLTEAYGRPALVIASDNGTARGSARTVRDVSIIDAIAQCSDLLERWGGHDGAAGFTLATDNVPGFAARLEHTLDSVPGIHDWRPVLACDVSADHDDLTLETARHLQCLEPFGHGNPEPMLHIAQLRSQGLRPSSDRRTLLLSALTDRGVAIDGVAFRQGERLADFNYVRRLDVVGHLRADRWKGREKLKLVLSDLCASPAVVSAGQ